MEAKQRPGCSFNSLGFVFPSSFSCLYLCALPSYQFPAVSWVFVKNLQNNRNWTKPLCRTADLDLVSWLSCSPKDLLEKLMVALVWEPAVRQRGEAPTRGWHTTTAAHLGHCLKGKCFLGYLQKRNGSASAYTMTLTSYLLKQWR